MSSLVNELVDNEWELTKVPTHTLLHILENRPKDARHYNFRLSAYTKVDAENPEKRTVYIYGVTKAGGWIELQPWSPASNLLLGIHLSFIVSHYNSRPDRTGDMFDTSTYTPRIDTSRGYY